jgi:hypothetical protein
LVAGYYTFIICETEWGAPTCYILKVKWQDRSKRVHQNGKIHPEAEEPETNGTEIRLHHQ